MQLFSFKKPVEFKGDRLIVRPLALNHDCVKENNRLVVSGYDQGLKRVYKAIYNKNGQLLFIRVKFSTHSIVFLSWCQEYDIETSQKIDRKGNSFSEQIKYLTTDSVSHKLVKRVFISIVNGEKYVKEFFFDNGITSQGEIPMSHRKYWLK